MTQDEAKRLVAKRAAELVHDGQAVGLGTGTTATLFIHELAVRKLKISSAAYPTPSLSIPTSSFSRPAPTTPFAACRSPASKS